MPAGREAHRSPKLDKWPPRWCRSAGAGAAASAADWATPLRRAFRPYFNGSARRLGGGGLSLQAKPVRQSARTIRGDHHGDLFE